MFKKHGHGLKTEPRNDIDTWKLIMLKHYEKYMGRVIDVGVQKFIGMHCYSDRGYDFQLHSIGSVTMQASCYWVVAYSLFM